VEIVPRAFGVGVVFSRSRAGRLGRLVLGIVPMMSTERFFV
jgi:hypothetical protein